MNLQGCNSVRNLKKKKHELGDQRRGLMCMPKLTSRDNILKEIPHNLFSNYFLNFKFALKTEIILPNNMRSGN